MLLFLCLCITTFTVLSASSSNVTFQDFYNRLGPLENYKKLPLDLRIQKAVLTILSDARLNAYAQKEADELGFSGRVADTTVFPCKDYGVSQHGNNVNELIPRDIKVIAALGDSLTAGLGIDATSILNLLTENKGKVFSIGGQRGFMTLTNFVRVYNPDVRGFSMINSTIHRSTDGLNLAVSGATAKDLMGQTDNMISHMRADPEIDMEKDWKLITILIGNNDVCRSCEFWNAKDFTVAKFTQRMRAVLDKLQAEVPRAFVNIVTMLDVYEVKYTNIGLVCGVLHLYTCPCVAYSLNINKVIKYTTKLQLAMYDIVAGGRYDKKDDFTAVVQPFFQNTFLPKIAGKPDLSYMAPDCFHLSEKGHGQVALSLWNSIFDKVGKKRTSWHAGETFDCPSTANPYLRTRKNSAGK